MADYDYSGAELLLCCVNVNWATLAP